MERVIGGKGMREMGGGSKKREEKGREGRPPIHISGYATGH